MAALIDFICVAHTDLNGTGPLVTLFEGQWAYCGGHGTTEHQWQRLEPARPVHAVHQLTAPWIRSDQDAASVQRRA
jgi:hypothetical protein